MCVPRALRVSNHTLTCSDTSGCITVETRCGEAGVPTPETQAGAEGVFAVVEHPVATVDLAARLGELLQPDAFAHRATDIQLRETHISWVILAGPYAYKIRKPVNFG